MQRHPWIHLLGLAILSIAVAGSARATPAVNGATIETRTFNDCPLSTVTTVNDYPSSIAITDAMDPACLGFANLHSFSLSADGGVTAAVFDNNSNFRIAADLTISGAGEGEGGRRNEGCCGSGNAGVTQERRKPRNERRATISRT